jgi:hypothetical protein
MILEGFIITYGTLAVTIDVGNGQQYYAPYEEISPNVVSLLGTTTIRVVFEEDRTRFSGHSRHGPRFYATSVMLKDTVLL